MPIDQNLSFSVLSGLCQSKSEVLLSDNTKLIAFYLPQFHRIKENSEWWGNGFTEWTNVVQGRPNFIGHYQPHIPEHLGFYDLSNVEVIKEQSEIAKLFGIHGFCFYYYWFSGRRILEKPVDNFLDSDIDMNFCLCWANENWTRTWDGDNKTVLLEQKYSIGDDESFIASLIPYIRDKRYIRVNNKPMLIVYRANQLPNPKRSFDHWRTLIKQYGFEDLHICAVDFYDISDPAEVNADALVEFPPHKFNGPQNQPSNMPNFINSEFSGGILEYSKIIAQSMRRKAPSFRLYRGIIPSWDNTARRQNTPTTVIHSTPELYGEWLSYLRAYTRKYLANAEDNFLFINAWNEWGEGCHLEPDLKWGTRYLDETFKSSFYSPLGDLAGVRGGTEFDLLERYLKCDAMDNNGEKGGHRQEIIKQVNNYEPTPIWVLWISRRLMKLPYVYKLGKWVYLRCVNLKACKK